MDPPLVNEASFTAASNPSSYSLVELLSLPMGGNIGNFGGGDGSLEESTVTELSGNGGEMRRRDYFGTGNCFDYGSSKLVSSFSAANHDSISAYGKRTKPSGSGDEDSGSKTEAGNSRTSVKKGVEKAKSEPPKDYIHVRARRGQATDSHSLAERARREKISERMKILQDLVPGCNKVIGKALVLDEIINYIQSLQRQVEFMSMKLEAINSRPNPTMEGFPTKDLAAPVFDANGVMYGSQAAVTEYSQGAQAEWLHMQAGGAFSRAT